MLIGELAKATGAKANTIRYYEEIGLLPKPERSASGQRVYHFRDLERLSFIRNARNLGFSLESVRSLLAISRGGSTDCSKAGEIAKDHLRDVEHRIERLTQMHRDLRHIIDGCNGGAPSDCKILRTLRNPVT